MSRAADAGSAGVGWRPLAFSGEVVGNHHGARSVPDFRDEGAPEEKASEDDLLLRLNHAQDLGSDGV